MELLCKDTTGLTAYIIKWIFLKIQRLCLIIASNDRESEAHELISLNNEQVIAYFSEISELILRNRGKRWKVARHWAEIRLINLPTMTLSEVQKKVYVKRATFSKSPSTIRTLKWRRIGWKRFRGETSFKWKIQSGSCQYLSSVSKVQS
jgi:hypothetical protein